MYFYVIVFKLSTHVIPVCVAAMKKAVEQTDMSYFLNRLKNKRQLYVLVASTTHLFNGNVYFDSDRRMRTNCMD